MYLNILKKEAPPQIDGKQGAQNENIVCNNIQYPYNYHSSYRSIITSRTSRREAGDEIRRVRQLSIVTSANATWPEVAELLSAQPPELMVVERAAIFPHLTLTRRWPSRLSFPGADWLASLAGLA